MVDARYIFQGDELEELFTDVAFCVHKSYTKAKMFYVVGGDFISEDSVMDGRGGSRQRGWRVFGFVSLWRCKWHSSFEGILGVP